MARLKDKYRSEVMPALKEHFGYKNVMEIPRLEKVASSRAWAIARITPRPWSWQ